MRSDPMSLLDELTRLDPGLRIWQRSGHWTTVAQVTAALAENAGTIRSLGGKTVAIASRSNEETAWLLTCLDGFASALLLLPAEQSLAIRQQFIEQAHCDFVAGSGAVELATVPSVELYGPSGTERAQPGALEPGNAATEWIIPTSGTTGTPKLVAHNFSSLTRTAQRNTERGAAMTWGLLYEVTRFAGLQVFLQALCGGSGLVFTDTDQSIAARVNTLAAGGCNALSATPSMWRKLMMLPEFDAMQLRWITLGGEIADQPVLNALAHRFPGARITHVYASTEAGVGFSVKDGLEGFPAAYTQSPQGNVELKVDADGMLHLRNRASTQHYFEGAEILSDESGWINTGDQVRLADSGRYVFLGRANGAINVGGSKVHPAEVERTLLELEPVQLASVRGRKNSLMGHLVEAAVVLKPGTEKQEALASIRAHCAQSLLPYQRPAIIKIVDSLDLNATGKVTRE